VVYNISTEPGVTGATEEYDGTSWTSNPTGLNTARYGLAAAGTQTAGLAFGGATTNQSGTEEYDGSTWTASNPLNTARRLFRQVWYTNCSFRFWWRSSPVTGATELYDGTTWTTSPASLSNSKKWIRRLLVHKHLL
jgi:hypothetical protein